MRLALLLLLLSPAAPPSPDALFALGQRLAAQGDVAGAVAAYRDILRTGSESAALYGRLGEGYLHLDQPATAIWAYEQALRLAPREAALQHNLALARERAGVSAPTPPPGIGQVVDALARPLGSRGLLAFGGTLYALALFGIGRRIWRGRWATAWTRRATWGTLALGVALLAVGGVATAERQAPHGVLLEAAALHPTPGQAAQGTPLPAGLVVRVLDTQGPWQHVHLPDGTTGWVPAHIVQ